MSLLDVKLNSISVVKDLEIDDYKTKIRLMELGIIKDCKIIVKKKSMLKKTLLVIFNNSCFTLKDDIASKIMVEYA